MNSLDRRTFLKLANLYALGAATGCSSLSSKSKASKREPETRIYVDDVFLKHSFPGHAENPYRVEGALICLQGDQCSIQNFTHANFEIRNCLQASDEELLLVHTQRYIQTVKNLNKSGQTLSSSRWAPYGGPFAFEAAAKASGACIALFKDIAVGASKNGFAIVRPPGHHAHANHSDGYCLFNNIAVGIRTLLKNSPLRIAIVDFDVHHGDGIEDVFYEDSNVLYISTHQNDWPYTGKIDRLGQGAGAGLNMNIPLPYGTGDTGFQQIFSKLIVPKVERFRPDFLVVAAGYDGHWKDPQGSLALSLKGLHNISENLISLADRSCGGKIAFVLEGGYSASVVSQGIMNSILALQNEASGPFDSLGPAPTREPDITKVVQQIARLHQL